MKRKGVIDFGDFVKSLNVFHPNAAQEDKINCKWNDINITDKQPMECILVTSWFGFAVSFKLYDLDGTGYIERQEVCYS